MKKIAWAVILLAAGNQVGFAQTGRGGEGCQAPTYVPNCSAGTRALDTQPRGAYVRSPETGEQAGESTGLGLRGFGIRLPAVSLDLPEIRFPTLVKYRRNAEMHVEGSRAPWVEGRALEFNQVPRNLEDNSRSLDQPRDFCIPPAPCTTETERKLHSALAKREDEMQQIQSRFDRLERIVEKLADSQSNGVALKKSTPGLQKIVEAGYSEEESEPEVPTKRLVTRYSKVQTPSASEKRIADVVEVSGPAAKSNVGYSNQTEDDLPAAGLGVWTGEGKRPTRIPSGPDRRIAR